MSAIFKFDSRKLQDLVRIEEMQITEDGAGGYSSQWRPWAIILAHVTPIRMGFSQEMTLAGQQEVRRMVRIILRSIPQLDYTMRVIVDELAMGIISITALDSRNQWQEIIASEGRI